MRDERLNNSLNDKLGGKLISINQVDITINQITEILHIKIIS